LQVSIGVALRGLDPPLHAFVSGRSKAWMPTEPVRALEAHGPGPAKTKLASRALRLAAAGMRISGLSVPRRGTTPPASHSFRSEGGCRPAARRPVPAADSRQEKFLKMLFIRPPRSFAYLQRIGHRLSCPQQANRAAMSCDLGLTARAIIGGPAGKFRGGDLAAAPGAASTLLPVWD
jgi:hypothetical protein